MRVLQLIDSLRSGGAERMSVTYANALAKRIDGSFLCCTRKEGLLKKQLSPEVGYLFLNKKRTLDLQAFLKLRKFVKENKINLIQAHSSSWFLAMLVKLSLPGLKLVWHDHYGRELKNRHPGILKQGSKYLDGIISVNLNLKRWAEENLNSEHVRFFRNFLPQYTTTSNWETGNIKTLKGAKGARIICLANLRPQKDHLNLLRAFELVEKRYPQASLHLIGKEAEDEYFLVLETFVHEKGLQEKVIFYGERENVEKYLEKADIGVLSSSSEGLPVALLEYGQAGLPVVCTDVGECAEVIGVAGKIVPSKDSKALAEGLLYYLKNEENRKAGAVSFQQKIRAEFSEEENLIHLLEFYDEILRNDMEEATGNS